jgi:uncharacterized repeat protein (TIGR04138 family)
MTHDDLVREVEALAERDGRYPKEAFFFVFEALQFTVKSLNLTGKKRHVTGQQLAHGMKDFALDRFGPMSLTVLEHWHIRTTRDFGEMVFALVNAGLMGKTEDDSIEDFVNVYDFQKEFEWRATIKRNLRK